MAIAASALAQQLVHWPAEERVRLGVTVADLAAEAGIRPARLVEWETGQTSAPDEERRRLEAALALIALRNGGKAGPTARQLIWVDEAGVAWVDDTNRKVKEIAEEHVALGWVPEQIRDQHPDLTLSQIHAALAYYHDHQEALDAELGADVGFADESRRNAGESAFARRLRESGRIR